MRTSLRECCAVGHQRANLHRGHECTVGGDGDPPVCGHIWGDVTAEGQPVRAAVRLCVAVCRRAGHVRIWIDFNIFARGGLGTRLAQASSRRPTCVAEHSQRS